MLATRINGCDPSLRGEAEDSSASHAVVPISTQDLRCHMGTGRMS